MPGLAIAEGRGSGGGTAAEEQRVQSLPECLSIKRAHILMPDLRCDLTQPLLKAGALLGRIEWSCRSEEHTSELQSLMRISYAVFCLKKKKTEVHCPPITELTHTSVSTTHIHDPY